MLTPRTVCGKQPLRANFYRDKYALLYTQLPVVFRVIANIGARQFFRLTVAKYDCWLLVGELGRVRMLVPLIVVFEYENALVHAIEQS